MKAIMKRFAIVMGAAALVSVSSAVPAQAAPTCSTYSEENIPPPQLSISEPAVTPFVAYWATMQEFRGGGVGDGNSFTPYVHLVAVPGGYAGTVAQVADGSAVIELTVAGAFSNCAVQVQNGVSQPTISAKISGKASKSRVREITGGTAPKNASKVFWTFEARRAVSLRYTVTRTGKGKKKSQSRTLSVPIGSFRVPAKVTDETRKVKLDLDATALGFSVLEYENEVKAKK